ncbi:MAG TPA: methionine biosynthesis protein MetW, partial [Vicinamibacteria bacterium]|nr:methionine biosynthesis protein MetW [Vicinamibacteria bacterium]
MSTRLDLDALRLRLEAEEEAYARLLGALDGLAAFPLPAEAQPDAPALVEKLNALVEAVPRPAGGGLLGGFRKRVFDVLAPSLQRQAEWNAALVQLLNGQVTETNQLHARLREIVSALVQYLQRVLPVIDARDRMATALATTRSELILEAFDRRLESLGRRLEGLLALRDRIEALGEGQRALEGTLKAGAPPPALAQAALRATADSAYTAFENRYRGDREEIRERLSAYGELFVGLSPVVDLGCGRGEFLDILRGRDVIGLGVESNGNAVQECLSRGLDVTQGDLVSFLRERKAASLGGVFAAQVAEHLPPAALQGLLSESHRALRPGGLLLLETVNPRSVTGFLEVYNRDLTHERPLHPDTLSFLAAAAGFTEVRVELRSPV